MSDIKRSGPAPLAEPSTALAALAALVLKEHVLLGALPGPQRAAALGLAWCTLPEGVVLRESDVNAALKHCLAAECSFLDVDHVELRRWLVDMGWLARDGFGREYRRVAAPDLAAGSVEIAAALAGVHPPAWVAELRADHAAQRAARRRVWETRQASAHASERQGSAKKRPA